MGNLLTPSIVAGFNVFNGLKKNIKITNINGSAYSTSTGKVTGTPENVFIKGFVYRYKDEAIIDSAGAIQRKDRKIVFQIRDVICNIDVNSKLTIADDVYKVIDINKDLGENTLTIQARK